MWEIVVHLAVACDVYDGVFLCCPFFPRGVLDKILNLIESVSEGFLSYSSILLEDHRQEDITSTTEAIFWFNIRLLWRS